LLLLDNVLYLFQLLPHSFDVPGSHLKLTAPTAPTSAINVQALCLVVLWAEKKAKFSAALIV
jgi:hypothetical protein